MSFVAEIILAKTIDFISFFSPEIYAMTYKRCNKLYFGTLVPWFAPEASLWPAVAPAEAVYNDTKAPSGRSSQINN